MSIFQISDIAQDNALSTQTEDLFDRADGETMEQVRKDVQVESIDPAVQEVCPISITIAPSFDALSPKGYYSQRRSQP